MKNKTSLTWLRSYHKRAYKSALTDLRDLVACELNGIEDEGFVATAAFDITLSRVIREGASLNALMHVESLE